MHALYYCSKRFAKTPLPFISLNPQFDCERMRYNHRFKDEERKGDGGKRPKNRIISSSRRGAQLKAELLGKILPWEKITVSLENFPHYIDEIATSFLKECASSHLKQRVLRKYGSRLTSSNQKILLRSIPATELYRERLVSALARDLQVPLLKLDDDHGCEKKKNNDREGNGGNYFGFSADENTASVLKKGDRVLYVGTKDISFKEVNNWTLSYGQGGEVYEVNRDKVAVAFNICGLKRDEAEDDGNNTEILRKAVVTWLDENKVRRDLEVRTHDCFIALEVLYQLLLESLQPVIVYFSDSFKWPTRESRIDTIRTLKNTFKQLPEGVVMICAQDYWEAGVEEQKGFPKSLKEYFERLRQSACEEYEMLKPYHQRFKPSTYNTFGRMDMPLEIDKLFTNIVWIKPPMDEGLLRKFIKQMEEKRLTLISVRNLKTIHKVLKDLNLSCVNLELPNTGDIILTRQEAEKIVGWATNNYLSSSPGTCVNKEKLQIPQESIKVAISRLMGEKGLALHSTDEPETDSNIEESYEELATDVYEKDFVPAVVCPEDIDVVFDDIFALENVKKTIRETVVLPLERPELFSHGNLLRPCKGVLLFGPPGAGKTAVAKALASESWAYLINITSKTFTSMQPSALFSYAKKLAPVIIFLDEVDSLYHNENSTNRLNEFITAWDGLDLEESHEIVVVGSTNRPYDLDEAVICRMPRRFYVGPPNVTSRLMFLRNLLNKENLEFGFSFDQLAEATEGYSEGDLKNLCIAAACRPYEEFLEQESEFEVSTRVSASRALNLNDFIHSKARVGPSVESRLMKLRKWNEQYGAGECQWKHS